MKRINTMIYTVIQVKIFFDLIFTNNNKWFFKNEYEISSAKCCCSKESSHYSLFRDFVFCNANRAVNPN